MNILLGVAGGNLPTWMVKSFPVDVRYSAIAIGYNSAQALFGGTAGILATLIYR
jgi:MHS family proline/betaine transporter-like MFS transporter